VILRQAKFQQIQLWLAGLLSDAASTLGEGEEAQRQW